jgi:hypothetical protein
LVAEGEVNINWPRPTFEGAPSTIQLVSGKETLVVVKMVKEAFALLPKTEPLRAGGKSG